jgi:hypothetical protein
LDYRNVVEVVQAYMLLVAAVLGTEYTLESQYMLVVVELVYMLAAPVAHIEPAVAAVLPVVVEVAEV